MRIGLLTAWANRTNGGVFEAVATHAGMLVEQGFTPHVFALTHPDDERDALRFDGIEVTRVPVLGPKIVGFGKGLTQRLIEAGLDILHLHGIWTHVSAGGAEWARATGRPYIISPHGMCDQWIVKRSQLKKAVAMAWFERRSWGSATLVHALTDAEAIDVINVMGHREIAVIPNGIGIPDWKAKPASPSTMVLISRIHPKKNLNALIEAWRSLQAAERGWRLIIAGWGNNQDVAQFNEVLGRAPEKDGIFFDGPVFGEAKSRLLSEASFVVLPSLSEGLPMAVLEAWSVGVPTLISDACHLPEGYEVGAALHIGTSVDEIQEVLQQAMNLKPAAREVMARAARALAIERFSTRAIADRWGSLYRSLVD